MKVNYPHKLSEGGEAVTIYRSVMRRRGHEATIFKIVFRNATGRQILNRLDEKKAHKDAKAELLKLLRKPVPFELTDGAGVMRSCQAALAGLNIEPDDACRQFAAALRKLEGATLADAVAAYLRNRPVKLDKDVDALVKWIVEEMTPPAVSWDYFKGFRSRVRRFARTFGKRTINTIEKHEIESWLGKLAVGNRSWNNQREAVLRLFNWSQGNKYLPEGVQNEAAKVRVKKATSTIHIFTVKQAEDLLTALVKADSPLLRYVATGLFTGIRPTEMTRLEQERSFRYNHGDIEVRASEAKTGHRRLVPMEANWKAWMSRTANLKGSFTPADADEKLAKFAKSIGLEWHNDIMRHSYISYMVAREQQIGNVALWAGNSEYVIKKNYLKMVTKAEGDAYFNIMPDWPANVIPMGAHAA